ncbi:hypothetical protein [Parachryseolinea silvisoli]|uniref:hypothetical protein n=1 Tax=Parachryseolinea silvisoli TaxID=2873601 RepID=UPI00226592D2|nr:hypothetical protein [Parachryseolinea silvisoli]MCD9016925.1 hypothetical protein [Parachryseolinea silvisoli]
MKKLAWLVVCILSAFPLFSQQNAKKKKSQGETLPWYEGSILLTDETRLVGQVRYDDRHGVLSYQDGDDSKAFNERRVIAFEFFDQELKQRRQFITLPFEESGQPFFFEILKELKTFAILVKTDLLEMKQNNAGGGSPHINASGTAVAPSTMPGSVRATQLETVYLMSKDGELFRLFKRSVDHDPDDLVQTDGENDRGKGFYADHLIACIGKNRYMLLEKYAQENKLSFNRKRDLVKVMNYYAQTLEPSDD